MAVMKRSRILTGSSAIRIGRRYAAAVLTTALLAVCLPAEAQVLERIEIRRTNGHAEIHIGFGVQVQYLRHAPPGKGKELNIFIQRVPPASPEPDIAEESLTSPDNDIVPHFTVTYPRLGNALTVAFAQETQWEVRPGSDGRSITIVVPVLRGAQDVLVEVQAPPPVPKPVPAPAPVPVPAPKTATVDVPAAIPSPAVVAAVPVPTPTVTPAAAPAAEPVPAPAPAAATTPAAVPAEPMETEVTKEEEAPAPPVFTAAQIDAMAKGFMDDANKALEKEDLARAINRLNRTLGLPDNSQTEPAQAMIGEVRELNGEIAKARAEYELYLKLYPKGPSARRIKERLAALPSEAPRAAPRRQALRRVPAEWTVYGGLSQYYYTGKSHIEITTPPPPGLLDYNTDTLSLTDQKALISNVDLNARRRDGVTDTRIVFRDTDTRNYLNSSRSHNRLYSAYFEQSDKEAGYFVRAGRQTPNGAGVLERFDGVNAGYEVADRWRINGVAGKAVEFLSPFSKNFYGFSLEYQPQPDSLGLTGYVIRQNLEGKLNRQAVGLEARYFNMHTTMFGMLDYDTLYKGVNIAMLQGNYRSDDGTNYFTYLDHRKTPPYSLTNAYVLLNGMTIEEAIAAVGIEQMRADAAALTATSNMASFGMTRPVSPRWTLGLDYRAASISGTTDTMTYATWDNPVPTLVPAMPSSGTNHVLGVQAIGNSLLAANDIAVVNGNYIKGKSYNGQALGGNYVYPIGDAWRFDLNLRYYQQKDDQEQKQTRTTPSLRVGYHWKLATIEAEAGLEKVNIDGPSMTERSTRQYFFVGYRLDFR